VVLADRGRGFVQVIASGIADTGMNFLDSGFGLFPVVAELFFAAHRPLGFGQRLFVALEAVEWRQKTTVAQRGKPGNAHIDVNNSGR